MHVKKILLIPFFCGFYFVSQAQFQKGTRVVGVNIGTVNYSSGDAVYTYPGSTTGYTKTVNDFNLNVNPSYGWFLNEKTAVGTFLLVGYSHNKTFLTDAVTGNTYKSDQINKLNVGIGAFARHYLSTSGKFYPFGQLGFNVGISSSKTEGYFVSLSPSYKYTYAGESSGDFFANLSPVLGLTKMLNKNTGLDFSVGYNYSYSKSTFKETTKYDVNNDGTIDQTELREPTIKFTGHGLNVAVGFQIFLDPKK